MSDLQDSGCVQQVCDELWQSLATEGQPEQVAASALSWEQLPANSGLLHRQGQSRQPTHTHTSAETTGINKAWNRAVFIRVMCVLQCVIITMLKMLFMLHLLSVNLSRMMLPATGILMGKLFKTLPVVSVYQTENWFWRESKHTLSPYCKNLFHM